MKDECCLLASLGKKVYISERWSCPVLRKCVWSVVLEKLKTSTEWALHSAFHTHLSAIIHVKCLLSSTWNDYSHSSTICVRGWFDAFISCSQGLKQVSTWKKSCWAVWESQKPLVFFSLVCVTFIVITWCKSGINKTLMWAKLETCIY